jgi:hypothetical protein
LKDREKGEEKEEKGGKREDGMLRERGITLSFLTLMPS